MPFLTTDNPLYYLRGQTYYQEQLGEDPDHVQAPYRTGANKHPSDQLVQAISGIATEGSEVKTRSEQCRYYREGALQGISSVVYNDGDNVGNVGYWNFFYDQAGNEGYQYATDAGGYSSNTINWNAANAAVYNGEFAPGGAFKTLKTGYSKLFVELLASARSAADTAGIGFTLTQCTRLHSIWIENGAIQYRTATAAEPFAGSSEVSTTDYAFLAMPRHSVELVARATRYQDMTDKTDFLNVQATASYLESVVEQPSYKIAVFFDRPWWEKTPYPPKLVNGKVKTNVFGPTITDLPLRQVYYFGDNSANGTKSAYGLLASYDDMRFVRFWEELEVAVDERRSEPPSWGTQPLQGPATATQAMVQMLRLELAKVHYGNPDSAWEIPEPLETVFMDWSQQPFGAGYHAWAAHYDITDVMQKIRTPATLGGANGANVFLIGSAYSNDQAWVEGAFCTAESVLEEYLGLKPIADTSDYPLICC